MDANAQLETNPHLFPGQSLINGAASERPFESMGLTYGLFS